jgi:alpha-galactosidase
LIVHTFKNGATPPVEKHLENWKIHKEFGSSLDGDFRGKCYYLRKN